MRANDLRTELADHESADVRQAMAARLPLWSQAFFSRFTGKALPGQTLPHVSALRHLIWALLCLAVGVALSAVAANSGHYLFLLPGWALTVHAARKLQLTIVHYCAHGTVLGTKGRNVRLGGVLSLLLFITEFDKYKHGHIGHHKLNVLSTPDDPTMQFLLLAGLEPGLTKRVLRRRLLTALVSPRFHLRVLRGRVVSHFAGTSWRKRVAAAAYGAGLLFIPFATGAWLSFLLAIVVPLVLLYQISQLLRLCAEHSWSEEVGAGRTREDYAELTSAVFIGAAPPAGVGSTGARVLSWGVWGFSMTGHALARACVMVGDTPCHDDHHQHPTSRGWCDYQTSRQHNLERAAQNYREKWGLLRTIDANFESFSRCSRPAPSRPAVAIPGAEPPLKEAA
ncbi:MAG: fatty acid desaturase [Pyrinomonadaceae bacterium]